MKAVIFGAGSIGRGFIGDLLNRSGFEIVFIDIDKNLINLISDKGGYYVELIAKNYNLKSYVEVMRIIHGNNTDSIAREIETCDIIFTAVGKNELKYIVPGLVKGIKMRKSEVNIILCENMHKAHLYMQGLLREQLDDGLLKRIGFLRASVGRMVPLTNNKDLLHVKAEPYALLPVDGKQIVGSLPYFEGLEISEEFDYVIERKLYIHNLGHVACAWMGGLKGYTYIWQAACDAEVRIKAIKAMNQAAYALETKYDIEKNNHEAHIIDLMNRFSNRKLKDRVDRVGRDIRRKLSPDDRVIGALKLCEEFYCPSDGIQDVIVAGLHYSKAYEGYSSFYRSLCTNSIQNLLKTICKINDEHVIKNIIMRFDKIRNGS